MATIELIIGSMFSGKSTELLRRCRTYEAIKKNIYMINHEVDIRCGNEIKTHDNSVYKATKCKLLTDLNIPKNIDVIAIDEAQFFPDIVDFIKHYEKLDYIILIAGLDGDSNRNKFGFILDIIPYCNNVVKLHAMCSVCNNGTLGLFSKRYLAGLDDNNIVCVGAKEKYMSVCRKHYLID